MATETSIKTESCGKCFFWKPASGDAGVCRRQPPRSMRFEVDDKIQFVSRFPTTSSSDWCGEFKAK